MHRSNSFQIYKTVTKELFHVIVTMAMEPFLRTENILPKSLLCRTSEGRLEFFLNVFTESGEFTDKNICLWKGSNLLPLVWRPGWYHRTSKTHVRARNFILSPIHASLNLLNSMKVMLHSGKTPLLAHLTMICEYFGFLLNINHAEMVRHTKSNWTRPIQAGNNSFHLNFE